VWKCTDTGKGDSTSFRFTSLKKLFKASYRRYLVGDTHFQCFLFLLLTQKSLGFVFKKILVPQTYSVNLKIHAQKKANVCVFPKE